MQFWEQRNFSDSLIGINSPTQILQYIAWARFRSLLERLHNRLMCVSRWWKLLSLHLKKKKQWDKMEWDNMQHEGLISEELVG